MPFGVRSSGSMRSSASSDSQMVNVNTLHPIHIITTPYSLVKMLENCQCFGQNPPFTHPFWSTIYIGFFCSNFVVAHLQLRYVRKFVCFRLNLGRTCIGNPAGKMQLIRLGEAERPRTDFFFSSTLTEDPAQTGQPKPRFRKIGLAFGNSFGNP